jgi:hypothetical protein
MSDLYVVRAILRCRCKRHVFVFYIWFSQCSYAISLTMSNVADGMVMKPAVVELTHGISLLLHASMPAAV